MDVLEQVASLLRNALDSTIDNDSIHECGRSCTDIIKTHPEEVLEFAYQKLNCWPYVVSPDCWRRLYEEASICKALRITQLAPRSYASSSSQGVKRRRLETDLDDFAISELISTLDKAIMISGAACRLNTIHGVFELLRGIDFRDSNPPSSFPVASPQRPQMQEGCTIARAQERLTFVAFQEHLDKSPLPVIVPGLVRDWPAFERWDEPQFWLQLTLGGRRLIPVEIGRSYTDDDWGQQLMTFGQFLHSHLLPATPHQVGYLAQHDLFQQFHELRHDIFVPDYCYTTPSEAESDGLTEAGLSPVTRLEAPMTNAWFGPKGTKTPLHTDPYHNILCQVVGCKYVRLYPPSETPNLYPHGIDDKGINMENTSRVDVSFMRPDAGREEEVQIKIKQDFPLFEAAQYMEATLEAGECLYIPLGWWHYVESLSTSFSVSFWWN